MCGSVYATFFISILYAWQASLKCMAPSTTSEGEALMRKATRKRDTLAAQRKVQEAKASDTAGAESIPLATPLNPPATWKREEAFLRTGRWSGLSREPWEPSELGGSDVQRPLQLYAADLVNPSSKIGCNKYQRSNRKLLPGCMLYWCQDCGRNVGFTVMDHAESVLVPFEMMYTSCKTAPESFQLDNGCNLDQSLRNREPVFFRGMQIYIDEAHYRGHVTCSENYNTRAYYSLIIPYAILACHLLLP